MGKTAHYYYLDNIGHKVPVKYLIIKDLETITKLYHAKIGIKKSKALAFKDFKEQADEFKATPDSSLNLKSFKMVCFKFDEASETWLEIKRFEKKWR